MMIGIEYNCDEVEFMNEIDAMDNEVWKGNINNFKTQNGGQRWRKCPNFSPEKK